MKYLIIIILLLAGCSMKKAKAPNGWEFESWNFGTSSKVQEAGGYYIDPNGIRIGFGAQGYETKTDAEVIAEFLLWKRGQ